MLETNKGEVRDVSPMSVLDHALNQQLNVPERIVQEGEKGRVSSTNAVEREQSEKPFATQKSIPTPSIPPRSDLRRQRSSGTQSTIEKRLSQSSGPIVYQQSAFKSAFQLAEPVSVRQSSGSAICQQSTFEPTTSESTRQVPFVTHLSQSKKSDLEAEVQRLKTELELRDRHIHERDSLVVEQEATICKQDVTICQQSENLNRQLHRIHELERLAAEKDGFISRCDERFSEQVEFLNRQYEQMYDKDERIRRLEAEAVIMKNENTKLEREVIKQMSQLQSRPFCVRAPARTEGSTASKTSQSPPNRTRSAPSAGVSTITSTEALANEQESIFGIPVSRRTLSRSTTLPTMRAGADSRRPSSRIARSVSTNNIPLATVPEVSVSPPPPQVRRNRSTRVKGALAKVMEKVKGLGSRKGD